MLLAAYWNANVTNSPLPSGDIEPLTDKELEALHRGLWALFELMGGS